MNRLFKRNGLLSIINNSLIDSKFPINLSYSYNFGSLLGIMLGIQLISGILLSMYYSNNIWSAFYSVDRIMRDISYGWLLRYIHSNGAAMFFILVYIHIARGLFMGSFVGKKASTWFIGIIIFLLMIVTAFLGYTLVWGQMSYWAATVITNLLSTVPVIGNELVQWIWGGFNVDNPTLNRFFSLHYLLPFVIVAAVIAHIIVLHDAGASNSLGLPGNKYLITFHHYYSVKDTFGFILLFIVLLFIIGYYPTTLGHPDNYIEANPMVTPTHIVPEFYLLPFYALLRSIPNKSLGVIAMLASILILLVLPYLHNHIITNYRWRPIYKYYIYLMILNFLLLMWLGQAPVEEPYSTIGAICTFIYFLLIGGLYILTLLELFIIII